MKYFLLLIIAFFSIGLYSQNITVIEEETNTPIKNVQVSTNKQAKITDANGVAEIDTIETHADILISSPGYVTEIIPHSQLKANDYTIKLKKNVFEIDEITVSANRWEQRINEVSVSVVPVNVSNIDFTNPQTAADLLNTNERIYIQKSQLGGGSPMIRGFAANRVLIVIDGVRMNNAIFRSGNLQNIISIDPNSLQEAEIVFGPGSVIYGSDAIGGVMDFHTKQALFSPDKKLNFKLYSLIRYSSANNENTGNIGLNFGFKNIAFFTNYSYSKFDDLLMGNINFDEYTRPEYVQRINGIDSVLSNDNINLQKSSGYTTHNFMQKIRVKLSKNTTINYGLYFSTTSVVPRYDRLIQYSNDKLKYAEWYYGPQKWIMHNLAIENMSEKIFLDNIKLTIAYQDYTESRHDRKIGKTDIRERTENVKLGTLNLDIYKKVSKNTTIFYGLASSYNYVTSVGHERNIETNQTKPYASRYPNNSTYKNFDIYVQTKTILSSNLIFNIGARYSYIMINAPFDTTYYDFPFEAAVLNTGSATGSAGIVYSTKNKWNFSFNIASGFRAPNIDDIGKIFDSEPGNVVVPNPNLNPEYIYDVEFGIHKTASKFFLNAAIFFSYLDNAIVRRDFLFNDQDSIMYDGEMSKVQALVNDDYAIIYGIQANVGVQLTKKLILKTAYNYLNGHDKMGFSIRHVPPAYGTSHIIFFGKNFKTDLYAIYNAKILNENLSPSEQDKSYMYAADNNGNPYSPAWWTLNLKTQYKLTSKININAGIENILNVRYRPYSSGIVAPGRNIIVSVRVKI